jgi:hypothetical protein
LNTDSTPTAHDRQAWGRSFFSRLQRYRNLLLRRWWVLAAFLILALGIEAVHLQLAPPQFVSVGQMIVNIKLNIQQDSLYTEELGNFLGTQAALMQGDEVSGRARDRVAGQNPGVTPQPVALQVSVLPKTTIFILRVTGKKPGIHQGISASVHGGISKSKKEHGRARVRHHDCRID